jgi:hypothetical protein
MRGNVVIKFKGNVRWMWNKHEVQKDEDTTLAYGI